MIRLFLLSIRYNWDAHRSSPANLWAAALGMVFNNVLFVWGAWMMLFAGKERNADVLPYFLALNGMVAFAWGFVCFFAGGLRSLGDMVEEGALEPVLATPRSPLWLTAFSRSHATGLGDMIQGAGGLVLLAFIGHADMALRGIPATALATAGFAAIFVLAGSIPFFVPRGGNIGFLLIECSVSLSSYPTGKIFPGGMGRMILLLTPAAATGILPIEAVEQGSWRAFGVAAFAVCLLWLVAISVFRLGLRRYRTASLVVARM